MKFVRPENDINSILIYWINWITIWKETIIISI